MRRLKWAGQSRRKGAGAESCRSQLGTLKNRAGTLERLREAKESGIRSEILVWVRRCIKGMLLPLLPTSHNLEGLLLPSPHSLNAFWVHQPHIWDYSSCGLTHGGKNRHTPWWMQPPVLRVFLEGIARWRRTWIAVLATTPYVFFIFFTWALGHFLNGIVNIFTKE